MAREKKIIVLKLFVEQPFPATSRTAMRDLTAEQDSKGKSCVCRNLVVNLNIQSTSFTAKSKFQMMTTEHGFVLNLDSRKYDAHRTLF